MTLALNKPKCGQSPIVLHQRSQSPRWTCAATMPAAKRRQNAAHGASRGLKSEDNQSPKGRKKTYPALRTAARTHQSSRRPFLNEP